MPKPQPRFPVWSPAQREAARLRALARGTENCIMVPIFDATKARQIVTRIMRYCEEHDNTISDKALLMEFGEEYHWLIYHHIIKRVSPVQCIWKLKETP